MADPRKKLRYSKVATQGDSWEREQETSHSILDHKDGSLQKLGMGWDGIGAVGLSSILNHTRMFCNIFSPAKFVAVC